MTSAPDWYKRLLDTCPPAMHTQPRWEWPSRLDKHEQLATILKLSTADGRQFGLMDHQRLSLRLLTEYDPSTGLPRFFELNKLTPRQIGKTTVQFVVAMDRMLLRARPQRCVYASQSHNAGLKKMKEDWIPLLQQSGLKQSARMSWSLNTLLAEIRTAAGSYIRVVAGGTENADRGITSLDFALIDEALADRDDRKERVLQPAMLTVADSQQFLASTPGNMLSLYLLDKRRRAMATLGKEDATVALVEYAADETLPIDDPVTWRSANPALGQTIPLRAYERLYASMTEAAFRREALGQWVPDHDMPGGIPDDEWGMAQTARMEMGDVEVIGIDCTPDQARVCAVAANAHQVRFLESTADLTDVPGWLARLLVTTGARKVVVQQQWSLSHKTQELAALPEVEVLELSYGDWLLACGIVLSAFIEGDVQVASDDVLNDANASAFRRPRGSRWLWDRVAGSTDISPLVALTCALAGARMDVWAAPLELRLA